MINYTIKDNSILNIADNKYNFQFKIETVLEFDNCLVIMLDFQKVGNDIPPDDNVYGVDKNCKIVWQIKRPIKVDRPHNHITFMKKLDEQNVKCHDWDGAWWKVNVTTGAVSFIEWTK